MLYTYKHAAIENPASFKEWIVDKYYLILIADDVKSKTVLHLYSSATAIPICESGFYSKNYSINISNN